jgi:hypothetical protein
MADRKPEPLRGAAKRKAARNNISPGLVMAINGVMLLVMLALSAFFYYEAGRLAKLRSEGVPVTGQVINTERRTVESRDSDGHRRTEYRYFLSVVFEHPRAGEVRQRTRTTIVRYREHRDASPTNPIAISLLVDPEDTENWELMEDAQRTYRVTLIVLAVLSVVFALGVVASAPRAIKQRANKRNNDMQRLRNAMENKSNQNQRQG